MTFFIRDDESRKREVVFQLRLATAFERRFVPRLVRLFKRRGMVAARMVREAGSLGVDMALVGHEQELLRELVAHYTVVMEAFGKRVMVEAKSLRLIFETKDAASEFSARVNKWIEEFAPSRAVRLSDTTKRQIMDVLRRGTIDGESIDEIAAGIAHLTRSKVPVTRAKVIARTETHSASVAAGDEALAASGLDDVQREWIAVFDTRTRPSHVRVDGQRRKADDTWQVGRDNLRYPGDPRGSAREIIHCRCVLGAVIEDDEPTIIPVSDDLAPGAFAPARSVKEATERLGNSFNAVGLPGASLDVLNDILEPVEKLTGHYEGKLAAIIWKTKRSRAMGTYNSGTGTLSIQKTFALNWRRKSKEQAAVFIRSKAARMKKFDDGIADPKRPEVLKDILRKKRANLEAAEVWTISEKAKNGLSTVVAHELGHGIDMTIEGSTGRILSRELGHLLHTAGISRAEVHAISEYAAKNDKETFAELIAKIYESGSDSIPLNILKVLDQIFPNRRF